MYKYNYINFIIRYKYFIGFVGWLIIVVYKIVIKEFMK